MSLPPGQRQICLRTTEDRAERIKAAAMKEGIREMGPFCRELRIPPRIEKKKQQ
jgi:hypothetical protein